MPKPTLAETELGGATETTSFVGAPASMTTGFVAEEVKAPPVNLRVIVSAVSSARLVKLATPPERLAVTVPWSGPAPLASEAVTAVLLSVVSRLPYLSSSQMTGGS